MTDPLTAEPLTPEAFAPYGDVIDGAGVPDQMINGGRCARFSDLARIEIIDGVAGISLFDSETVTLPYSLSMMERHPKGSQAFLPTGDAECLVIVAEDEDGVPVRPRAFHAVAGQGFNILRNVWHGVLAPLHEGRFFVIDRIGEGPNLETHPFSAPLTVTVATEEEDEE